MCLKAIWIGSPCPNRDRCSREKLGTHRWWVSTRRTGRRRRRGRALFLSDLGILLHNEVAYASYIGTDHRPPPMTHRRQLSWSTSMLDLRRDRAASSAANAMFVASMQRAQALDSYRLVQSRPLVVNG